MIATRGVFDRRRFLAAGVLSLAANPAPAQQQALREPVEIAVGATPVEHFRVGDSTTTRFGRLIFRGGLELSARHEAFGGLSGLAMDGDGAGFLALTDVGNWLRARIVYQNDRPAALADCVIAPILNADGGPVKRTRWYDTESLCIDNGIAYVGIERVHDVMRFDWAKDRFRARGRLISVPPSLKKLPSNRGCEAIGVAPKSSPVAGALVAISERSGERDQPTKGFILTGPQRGEFSVVLRNEFDVTDLAFLPDGDMLILERYYRPLRGVAMRIRRIDGRTIKPDATLDGDFLIEADMSCQIDNMEALGVHVARDGAIVLTLLSDDNFSLLQRTLLLQFALAD